MSQKFSQQFLTYLRLIGSQDMARIWNESKLCAWDARCHDLPVLWWNEKVLLAMHHKCRHSYGR